MHKTFIRLLAAGFLNIGGVMQHMRNLVVVALGMGMLLAAPALHAADATFVGVLALASEDQTAKQLGLNDETRQALSRLVNQREADALELWQQVKDLSPDERAAKLAPFRHESEQQGLKLLTDQQRTRLQQLHLEHDGLASLADSAIGTQLQLTAEQQAKVADIMKERDKALAKASPQQRKNQQAYYERALGDVITPEQHTRWELMVGGVGENVAANSSDTTTDASPKTADAPPSTDAGAQTKNDTAKADGSKTASAKPDSAKTDSVKSDAAKPTASQPVAADTSSAASTKTTGKPAAATALKKSDNGKLLFNFRYAPWKEVLELFAEKADLSLVMDAPPPGTFNYQDDRSYDIAQAIDVLNSVLLTRDFALVRRDRMLMVVSLKDGIPPNVVPTIPLSELPSRGKYELILRRLSD